MSDPQSLRAHPFSGAMNPSKGLGISRRFTKEGQDPFWSTTYEVRRGEIEVPKQWSFAASDVLAQKFFCRSGVPQKNPDGSPQMHGDGLPVLGGETSAKQVIHRLVGFWRSQGEQHGYFATTRDASSFYDEVVFMMLHQMAAPDPSQCVGTGLNWAYELSESIVPLGATLDERQPIDADDPDVELLINSSNAVRMTNAFMDSVLEDREWHLRARSDGSVSKTMKARELWDNVADVVFLADNFGVQFETTMSEWHTCAKSGRLPESDVRASLNLASFFDAKTMVFDVDSFKHATRLWTVILEISARNQDFRILGLGYTNLGAGVLVAAGIPYDSKEARAVAGAITSIMTGESYAASAEIAKYIGSFPKFDLNRSDMLRVIRNHRRATYNAPAEEYEKLSIKPRGIDPQACPVYLLRAARGAWDRALELGEIYGYRNAQTTLISATSDIDVLLDCCVAGIDPDSSLVKFVKQENGDICKTINAGVPIALKILGYTTDKIEEIVRYVRGAGTLMGAPHINHAALTTKGVSDEQLAHIEQQLSGVADVSEAFDAHALGFNEAQIDEVNDIVCGTMTIEGAPHLKKEHYAVFDCGHRCGRKGERFIHHAGHIRMMAAVQPFLSGAISKIITMISDVNKDGVSEGFGEAWKMGLKSVTMRVGHNEHAVAAATAAATVLAPQEFVAPAVVTAPVPPTPVAQVHAPVPMFNPEHVHVMPHAAVAPPEQTMAEKIGATTTASAVAADPHASLYSAPVSVTAGLEFGMKRALPAKRSGITVEATVGNQQVYLRTGEYPNGDLGEIFIDMYREGAAFRSVLNCFAIAISMGLQRGVPLEKFVEKFTYTRFEPSGFTSHPNVKMCTSIVDYIFRVLAVEYLGRMDLAQVPPEGIEKNRADKLQEIATAALHVGEQTALLSTDAVRDNNFAGAPPCDTCGHITIKNGNCFRCMNCGSSMVCS